MGAPADSTLLKEEHIMAKAKKGDYMSCNECGLVLVVDEACGCAEADVICCDAPMKKGKAAAAKIKTKAKAAKKVAKKKVAKKPAKKVARKPAAKKVVKKKVAAKK
jgi:hypothetical protein